MQLLRKKKVLLGFSLVLLYTSIFLLQKDFVLAVEDLGRHLVLGKIIVTCHCIPKTNLLSFTNPNFPFINHHWFSEVIFYLLSGVFGINSLLVLKSAIIITCISIIFFLSLKKGSFFWVVVVALLEIKIFSERFHVRPELFSYLFIVLFILSFELYKYKKSLKCLFMLPLIELLWVNMHIYFPIGIGMYGLFLFEQIVIFGKKINKKLFVILILLFVSVFFNPNSWRGAILPFTIFHNYGIQINENQNIWFLSNLGLDSITIFTFEICAIILLFSFVRKIEKEEVFSISFAVFGIVAGSLMIRNLPIFVLASWVPLVTGLTILEKKIIPKIEKNLLITGKVLFLVIFLSLFFILDFFQALKIDAFGFTFLNATQAATAVLEKNHIHGPYFNNVIVGSYLSYAIYPKEKVFVDARPEAYPASFFNTYRKMESNETFFYQQMGKYHINAFIISREGADAGAFIPKLLANPSYTLVYKDQWTYLFVRK